MYGKGIAMKRFILLSFGFLGFAFYELSGGADFDPVAARDAALQARNGATAEQREQVAEDAYAPAVTRMALNLTSFSDARSGEPAEPQTATPAIAAARDGIAVTPVTFDTADSDQVVLPSIIFPGNTVRSSPNVAAQTRDLRSVSASAVNMREGPGTTFAVLGKLERNDQVEVLQDDGSGWVRLRPVAGGPEGWIADFLLTGG